jgi:hypothetical protein
MPAPVAVVPATDLRSLVSLRRDVCAAATAFDAGNFDGEAAAAAVQEWSRIVHAADTALALAAARLAACDLPSSYGAVDARDLVARTTGVTAARAGDAIQRGGGLTGQPATRAAATNGLLSADQARAIADAVAVNPDAENEAAAAQLSVGELRLRCAKAKAEKQDLEQIERQIHARRRLRRWRDADGAEHLHARGTKREMALIDQALKRGTDDVFRRARAEGEREPLEAYAFDALVGMAERYVSGASSGGPGKARHADPIRYLTLLRADLPALIRGAVEPGETCEIAGLGPVSIATAREMLTESVVKLVLTKGVEVRNVTHLGRGPITAQKIALLWEQPVCTREGCGRRARLEYDHIDGYEYRVTRHTRVDELTPLCDPDHDLKTTHGWALVEGTGGAADGAAR